MRMNQDERRFDFHGLGAALKRAREEKGWTQAYVAELVDRDSRTIKHRDIAFESMLIKIANNIILCLLSQICFVFDNCNLQHTRNLPIGFAFFLFCHHSTKCDKQCQKDFQEHLCRFSVKTRGASAKADAPLCVSCAFCKLTAYLPLLFRRGIDSVFVSLQTLQV